MRVTSIAFAPLRDSKGHPRRHLGVFSDRDQDLVAQTAGIAAIAGAFVPAAAWSGHASPWMFLLTALVLPRLAIMVRARSFDPDLRSLATAACDCSASLLIAAIGGHTGLAAAAWLVLPALACLAPGTRQEPQRYIAAIVALTLIGHLAILLTGCAGPFDPASLDAFGTIAALGQIPFRFAARTAPAKSDQVSLDRNAELQVPAGQVDVHESLQAVRLAALSHELRTPLNAIIGFAGLLKALPADQTALNRQHDYARIIESSGEHLLRVLEDAISGTAAGEKRRGPDRTMLDVGATIRAGLEIVAPAAALRSIDLQFIPPSRAVTTTLDRRALLQILINLLSNAIKFSPSGGRVVVTLVETETGIDIAVSDKGLGIAAIDHDRIGQPFARGLGMAGCDIEGSGLGLAISRQLAEQLTAELVLESEAGLGTTARLRLPIDAANSGPDAKLHRQMGFRHAPHRSRTGANALVTLTQQ